MARAFFGQPLCDDLVGFVHRIGAVENVEIAWADRAVFNERVEIDHLVPVFGAEQNDRHALAGFARLHQGQDLEHLVERAKTTREQHDRLGQVDKPEFAHKEVVEIKVQFSADIGVVEFFVRDRDRQSDIEPFRLGSAAIGGLHDAGTAAGADDKALLLLAELLRPFCQPLGELSRGFVIDRQRERHLRRLDALSGPLRLGQHGLCRLLRAQPRRPHKDDRVLDVVALEAIERLQILRQHPQRARIPASQKAGVLISLELAASAPAGLIQFTPRSIRFRPSIANKGPAVTADKPAVADGAPYHRDRADADTIR